MRHVPFGFAVIALSAMALGVPAFATAEPAQAVKVTVLSTMLAGDRGRGIGEWGFAALLEVDGRRLLLDAGERPQTVLRNALELGIDLSHVTDLVITHNHGDHTAGLVTLRRELAKTNARALSRAHVARGIFDRRPGPDGSERNGLLPLKAAYEALGGVFIEHAGPTQLLPAVWLTGPVPRQYPERNWSGSGRVQTTGGLVEDTIPEDASIIVDTADGLVVVSGCGHAGVINTFEYARKVVRNAPVLAAIGGFHLFAANDDTLDWTGNKLKEFGLRYLLGAHCTGIEAVYRLRTMLGLTRNTAVVGAVGSSFTLGTGISALSLAG
ncbi:MAG: MBL fold metallo-hydrolase [Acidobacteria bacterium]|nr:MBL fold metallo-hydrolase [Acidobacteriota bacterium]